MLYNFHNTELPAKTYQKDMERKRLLCEVVSKESTRFTVSRVVEQGVADFYELVKAQNLERIVAKRRDSRYYFDKRTKGWIKLNM